MGTVTVNAAVRHQTMDGWEATSAVWATNKGTNAFDATYAPKEAELFDKLVNEMGVNRLQMEIRSGWQNVSDFWPPFEAGSISYTDLGSHWYECIAGETTKFGEFDWKCEHVLQPFLDAMAAKGEDPIVSLVYIDFGTSGTFDHSVNASAYATFVKQFVDRMEANYGVRPKFIDLILEPENSGGWVNGTRIGNCAVALASALAGYGIRLVAPSFSFAYSVVPACDDIETISGAVAALDTISYHRYGGGNTDAGNIKTWAYARAKKTGMTEWFNATIDTLFDDLTIGFVSTWQKWAIAGKVGVGSNPQSTYYIFDEGAGTVAMATNSHHLPLIMRYVREGAERIDASASDMAKIVAFENVDGRRVVCMKRTAATASTDFSGLTPNATYGVRQIAQGSTTATDGADVVAGPGGTLSMSVIQGYTTLYEKAGADPMPTFGKVPGTPTGVTVTGLNSLANATYVASDEIDFTSAKPLDAVVEATLDPGTTTGNQNIKVFAIVSMDGTNFSSGPTSGTTTTKEPLLYKLGDIFVPDTNVVVRSFSLMARLGFIPKKAKIVFFNDSGVALNSSGNSLSVSMTTGDFTP